MDYLFCSSIRDAGVSTFVISYDIACQWHKHLFDRMGDFPRDIQFNAKGKTVVFLVPKFHLLAHIEECQVQFSFNLMKNVGRTDREAPERGWDHVNQAARAFKEMGPGTRRDAMDNLFNDRNWKKVVGMGMFVFFAQDTVAWHHLAGNTLLRKMTVAITKSALRAADHAKFEEVFPAQYITEWTVVVEQWEKDKSATNPFVIYSKGKWSHEQNIR
jgi:hypothetical protein